VDVDQVVKKGRLDKDPVVEAGDTILIPRTADKFLN